VTARRGPSSDVSAHRRAPALVAGWAALGGGLCWVVKGGAILATGVQPPLLFEVAPLLMGLAVLALARLSHRRALGTVLGSVATGAAVPVLVDEVVAVPEALTGGGMALATLAVLAGLAVVGTGPGRSGPSGRLPLLLATCTLPAVLLGGALTVPFGERALEIPIVALGAAWALLGGRLLRRPSGEEDRSPASAAGPGVPAPRSAPPSVRAAP
jgi:hypothetical protein